MKYFRITKEFRDLFPDAHIALVCLVGIDNQGCHPDIESELRRANEEAKKHLVKDVFSVPEYLYLLLKSKLLVTPQLPNE